MKVTKPSYHVLLFDGFAPSLRDYTIRKAHTKTKSGCLACKAKRVKCDEVKPTCARYRRNGRSCRYQDPIHHCKPKMDGATSLANRPSHGSCFSSLSSVTIIPFPSPSMKCGTSSASLMHHFSRHWDEIFHIPFSDEVALLVKSSPLVQSTVLAITASHLRHVSPGNLQHRIAEHYQQSLALKTYTHAFAVPRKEIDQNGANTLLLSAVLLNILSFALGGSGDIDSSGEDIGVDSSWVFSPREDRLGWLALQTGVRPLILSLTAYLEQTLEFLNRVFYGLGRESRSWTSLYLDPNCVPELWIQVFELHDTVAGCDGGKFVPAGPLMAPSCRTWLQLGVDPSNVFQSAALLLLQLKDVTPIGVNMYLNLRFLGKIQPAFRALLCNRNERALWLFGYWLGLLCRFKDIWWAAKRAKRDHMAICMWLDQLCLPRRPGSEGRRWAQMMDELKMVPFLSPVADKE